MSESAGSEQKKHSIQFKFDNRTLYYQDLPQDEAKVVIRALKTISSYLLKRSDEQYSSWREDDSGPNGVGSLIKALRKKQGVSQKELAEKLDIKQYNLSRLETGTRTISKLMAQRLGGVFNMDYKDFL